MLQRTPTSPARGFSSAVSCNLIDEPTATIASPVIASTSRPTLEQLTRGARQRNWALKHKVQNNDSLAGISLKYGCSVRSRYLRNTVHSTLIIKLLQQSAIRNANRLWISDSIHLRAELLVPLEACVQPPSRHLLQAARLNFDDLLLQIDSKPHSQAPLTHNKGFDSQSRAAARIGIDLTAGRFPDAYSNSSRGSSLDLLRVDGPSVALSRAATPINDISTSEPSSSNAQHYLASTNNIYASEHLQPPGSTATPTQIESGEPPPPLETHFYTLVEMSRASPDAEIRPSLANNHRQASFELDTRLVSPPRPPLASASAPSTRSNAQQSTTSTNREESWALNHRRRGGWSAVDADELDMAKDIMRHVSVGSVRDTEPRSELRRPNGLSDLLASWT